MKSRLLLAACGLLLFASCKSNSTAPATNDGGPSGTLYYSDAFDVNKYDVGSKKMSVLFPGRDPQALPNGKILNFIFGSDSKANPPETVIRESTPDGGQMTTKIDVVDWITDLNLDPHESKDGKYISFNYQNDATNGHFGDNKGTIVVDMTTGDAVVATNMWDGAWTPDERLVVAGTTYFFTIARTPGQPGLFIIDQQGNATMLGSGLTAPMYPSVSPDGKRVAFSMNGHLWIINIDGTGLRQLTNGSYEELQSAWSPDGKWIAVNCSGDFELTSGTCVAYVSPDAAQPTTISINGSNWFRDPSTASAGNGAVDRINSTGSLSWK